MPSPLFPYTAIKLNVPSLMRLVRSCLLGQEFQHHMFYTLVYRTKIFEGIAPSGPLEQNCDKGVYAQRI